MPTDKEDNLITLTQFKDKNEILKDINLQLENGYGRFDNGNYLVSVTCPMFKTTPDMIKWWFWHYPQNEKLFKSLDACNLSVCPTKDSVCDFAQSDYTSFTPCKVLQTQTVAGKKRCARLDFADLEQFGFDKKLMPQNDIALTVCAHVKTKRGRFNLGEACLVFRQEREGLFLVGRLWLGENLKDLIVRKTLLKESVAEFTFRMLERQFRSLAEILPDLYLKHTSK